MWMYPRYASASKFSLLGRICTGGTEFHRRKQARGLLSNQAPAGSSSWQLRIARELCPSGSGVDGCIDKSSDQTHAPAAADAHPKRGCVMCHPLQRRACHRTTCECAARGKADEGTLDLRPATVLPALAARSPVSTLPARCSAATPVGRRCMPYTLRRAAPAPPCTVAHRDCSDKLAQSLTWDVPTGVRRRRLPGLGGDTAASGRQGMGATIRMLPECRGVDPAQRTPCSAAPLPASWGPPPPPPSPAPDRDTHCAPLRMSVLAHVQLILDLDAGTFTCLFRVGREVAAHSARLQPDETGAASTVRPGRISRTRP